MVHVVHENGNIESFAVTAATPMIAVTLTDQDKTNVAAMDPACRVYSMYDNEAITIPRAEQLMEHIRAAGAP